MSTQNRSNFTVTCPITGSKLYTISDKENIQAEKAITAHSSYGTCVNCKKDYHYSALKIANESSETKWIIVYEGAWCLNCWDTQQT